MRLVFSLFKINTPSSPGFSLIELMVTISIVVLATAAVLMQYSGFNNVTLLKSQALEVSLDLRTAQQYGVNVRTDGGDNRSAYGIYFDADTPDEYILFRDVDDNLAFDAGEQIGDVYKLDSRFTIAALCVPNSTNTHTCSADRKASAAFKRPNFDAVIANSDSGGGSYTVRNGGAGVRYLTIEIASKTNPAMKREVWVYNSGQIVVE